MRHPARCFPRAFSCGEAAGGAGSGDRSGTCLGCRRPGLDGAGKKDSRMTGQKSEIRSAKKKEKMFHDTIMRPEKIIVVL